MTVHQYDIVMDVTVINRSSETLQNLCLELATMGDLKLVERPQNYTLAPGATKVIRANIKVRPAGRAPAGAPQPRIGTCSGPPPRRQQPRAPLPTAPPPAAPQVSSTETGVIFGNIVYEGTGYAERSVVVLNDIHIDIMDYISPASCADVQFRNMWAEFEWENKVGGGGAAAPASTRYRRSASLGPAPSPAAADARPLSPPQVAINTSITDCVAFLQHIAASTNMRVLTPPSALEGECAYLAANLYAKSVFGEDALVNVSCEKQPSDGKLAGYIRIRSKTQGIALSLGDKITLKQKG